MRPDLRAWPSAEHTPRCSRSCIIGPIRSRHLVATAHSPSAPHPHPYCSACLCRTSHIVRTSHDAPLAARRPLLPSSAALPPRPAPQPRLRNRRLLLARRRLRAGACNMRLSNRRAALRLPTRLPPTSRKMHTSRVPGPLRRARHPSCRRGGPAGPHRRDGHLKRRLRALPCVGPAPRAPDRPRDHHRPLVHHITSLHFTSNGPSRDRRTRPDSEQSAAGRTSLTRILRNPAHSRQQQRPFSSYRCARSHTRLCDLITRLTW